MDNIIKIDLCKDTPDALCETLDFELDSHANDLIQSIADKENKPFAEVLERILRETIENIVGTVDGN